MDEILVDRESGVVRVTLNRPETLNAITTPMWRELASIFNDVGRRHDDRVVVVTGAGGAFSSGADLGAAAGAASGAATGGGADGAGGGAGGVTGAGHPLTHMREVGAAAMALHRLAKPTVARVDGVAAGAGLNLALGCDLVVASERSRFSEIFVKRGLSVDFGGSWLLPRLVGMHRAKRLVLLAEMLSAAEAADLGLVSKVVAVDELDGVVDGWAAKLAAGPPLALSMSKRLLDASFEMSFDQAVEAEAQAQAVNLASEDVRSAMVAFLAKKEPVFRGR